MPEFDGNARRDPVPLECNTWTSLAPWRSDYLRWRIETYSGREAHTIGAREFFRFVWQEKGRLLRFLHWTGDLGREASFPRAAVLGSFIQH